MLLGVDGVSDFNGLHSRRHDAEVEFEAFDMLVSDGEDLRKLPLSMRKTNLARLLARRVDGIHLAPFEQGEIGSDLFRHPSDGTGGRERARKAELRVSGYVHSGNKWQIFVRQRYFLNRRSGRVLFNSAVARKYRKLVPFA